MKFGPRLQKKFRGIVSRLGQRRARKLLRIVEKPRGPQPELMRKWRERKIDEILEKAYLPHSSVLGR